MSVTRRVAAVAVVAVAAATTAACSSSESDGVELEFQTAMAVDAPTYSTLEELTRQFESEHPGINVDLRTGGNDYESQIRVRLAANDPPDIWATHGWSLLRYSQFLAPLQDEPWAEHVNPVLDPAMRDENGQFFALPITAATSGLIVNRTVLTEAGFERADLTTWDALAEAADAVAETGAVPFSLAGSKDGSAGNVVDWLAPGVLNEDVLDGMAEGTFDQAAYSELLGVVETMRERGWTNVDYTSATGDDMARALAEDRGAFALTPNALITSAWQYNPDADLTYVPVPAFDGGEPYMISGEDLAFGTAQEGPHLEEAQEYLAFLAEPENLAELAAAAGNPPGLTNATADLGPLEQPYEQYVLSGDVAVEPYFDRVYLPSGLWDTLVSTADGVVAGQTTPDAGAATMANEFATLYDQSAG